MDDEIREEIVNHAFESRTTLRAALLVGSAFADIDARLVGETLSRVLEKFRSLAGAGWVEERLQPSKSVRYGVRVRKSSWPTNLSVGLEAEKSDEGPWFGVSR